MSVKNSKKPSLCNLPPLVFPLLLAAGWRRDGGLSRPVISFVLSFLLYPTTSGVRTVHREAHPLWAQTKPKHFHITLSKQLISVSQWGFFSCVLFNATRSSTLKLSQTEQSTCCKKCAWSQVSISSPLIRWVLHLSARSHTQIRGSAAGRTPRGANTATAEAGHHLENDESGQNHT